MGCRVRDVTCARLRGAQPFSCSILQRAREPFFL